MTLLSVVSGCWTRALATAPRGTGGRIGIGIHLESMHQIWASRVRDMLL